jgi:hypothetical protein
MCGNCVAGRRSQVSAHHAYQVRRLVSRCNPLFCSDCAGKGISYASGHSMGGPYWIPGLCFRAQYGWPLLGARHSMGGPYWGPLLGAGTVWVAPTGGPVWVAPTGLPYWAPSGHDIESLMVTWLQMELAEFEGNLQTALDSSSSAMERGMALGFIMFDIWPGGGRVFRELAQPLVGAVGKPLRRFLFDRLRDDHAGLTRVVARRALEFSEDMAQIWQGTSQNALGYLPDLQGVLRDGRTFAREVWALDNAVTRSGKFALDLIEKAKQTRGYDVRQVFAQVPLGSALNAVVEGAKQFEQNQVKKWGKQVRVIVLDSGGQQLYP